MEVRDSNAEAEMRGSRQFEAGGWLEAEVGRAGGLKVKVVIGAGLS